MGFALQWFGIGVAAAQNAVIYSSALSVSAVENMVSIATDFDNLLAPLTGDRHRLAVLGACLRLSELSQQMVGLMPKGLARDGLVRAIVFPTIAHQQRGLELYHILFFQMPQKTMSSECLVLFFFGVNSYLLRMCVGGKKRA